MMSNLMSSRDTERSWPSVTRYEVSLVSPVFAEGGETGKLRRKSGAKKNSIFIAIDRPDKRERVDSPGLFRNVA